MADPLYRPILRRSWQIVIRFRSVWFFGLFAALMSGGGEHELIYQLVTGSYDTILGGMISAFRDGLGTGTVGINLWGAITTEPQALLLILAILLVALAITAFMIWLATISQIGLTTLVSGLNRGRRSTINETIDGAATYFWPVLAANAALKVVLALVLSLMAAVPLLIGSWGWMGIAFYYALILLAALLVFAIAILVKYQIYFIVLKGQSFIQALRSAAGLFNQYRLISLEMSCIIFAVYAIATLVILVVGTTLSSLPMIAALNYAIPPAGLLLILAGSVIAGVIGILWAIAALNAFQWSAWTLLFTKLVSPTETVSKVARAAQSLPTYLPIRRP